MRYKIHLILLLIVLHIVSIGSAQITFLRHQIDVDTFDSTITDFQGDLYINTESFSSDPITSLANLSNVQSVYGSLDIIGNQHLLNLNGLQNLNYVQKGLRIFGNRILDNVNDLSSLSFVGFSFIVENNFSLKNINGFTNLDSIIGSLEVVNNDSLLNIDGFSNLRFIGADLLLEQNFSLQNLKGFTNLKYIPNRLHVISSYAIKNIDCFINLDSIGNGLMIQFNDSLLNLNGLQNLTSIGNFPDNQGGLTILKNKMLTQLDGLAKLKAIRGNLGIRENIKLQDLKGLGQLAAVSTVWINENNSLVDLTGLSNLRIINGSLVVSSNNKLLNLNGLTNLKKIMGSLSITLNPSLVNIDSLANLESILYNFELYRNQSLDNLDGLANVLSVGKETVYNNSLSINLNEKLSDCCGIQHLLFYPELLEGNISISNSNSGCEDISEVISSSCAGYYYLKGYVRFDQDNNGCAFNDPVTSRSTFNISNNGGPWRTTVVSNGEYLLRLEDGINTIVPVSSNTYFQFDPDTLILDLPADSLNLQNDFCLTASQQFNDLAIEIIPLDAARPGFEASYLINYKNIGTQSLSGFINLIYPGETTTLISADPMVTDQSLNLLKWEYQDLTPFEEREITLTLLLNSPMDNPPLNGGEVLPFSANILPVFQDFDRSNNVAILNQLVVNAFDPNDKTCLLGNILKSSMVGQYVPYLIRFENTGTAPATFVKVIDTIHADVFDISTLVITSASHDFTATIEENVITFSFDYILLPFDDDNNDGYVSFKLKTWNNLTLGDSLKNSAAIYFDFNFPIRTNESRTVVSNLSSTQSIANFSRQLNISPNPVNDLLYMDLNKDIYTIQVYDVAGLLLISTKLNTTATSANLNVSAFPNGTYLVVATSNMGLRHIGKFIKMD